MWPGIVTDDLCALVLTQYNGDNMTHGLCSELNELILVKYLVWCLAYRKHSINLIHYHFTFEFTFMYAFDKSKNNYFKNRTNKNPYQGSFGEAFYPHQPETVSWLTRLQKGGWERGRKVGGGRERMNENEVLCLTHLFKNKCILLIFCL